jgi:hypothetical protein
MSQGVTVKFESFHAVENGLCGDCVQSAICTLRNGRKRRVLECDEYLSLTEVGLQTETIHVAVNRADGGDNPVPTEARTNGRLGLCSHCAGWETCRYSVAESGVWHCDEYR